jgi:hypothetical protein
LLRLKIHDKVSIAVFVYVYVKVGVSQQYNIYSKTTTFFESGEIIVSGAGRRASDLVQYDDMAFNYIIADAKGRWKQ